jgi:hypothetical protein
VYWNYAFYIMAALSTIAIVWQWAKPRNTGRHSIQTRAEYKIKIPLWRDSVDRSKVKKRRPGYKGKL